MIISQIYNGNTISFAKRDDNGEVMVNAKDMARPFNKLPKDWLKTEQAQRMINAISVRKNILTADLVKVVQGGEPKKQGTWFHEDVALVFAQWLSPEFYVWCNDKTKELLQFGVATTTNDDEAILHAMQILQKRVENEKQKRIEAELKNKELQFENDLQEHIINEQRPKVIFADAVTASEKSILIAELAKILTQNGFKIGQNRLFELLRKKGYLCHKGSYYNMPTQKAQELGLFEIKKTAITKPDGHTICSTTIKVTPKGQIYFINNFLHKEV